MSLEIAEARKHVEYAEGSTYIRVASDPSLASRVIAGLGQELRAALDEIEQLRGSSQ